MRRLRLVTGLVAALLVVGTACTPLAPAPAGPAPGSDARTLTGPSTAVLADDDVHPVDPGVPALPVLVDSYDGATVEVDDVSRILAVDLYGTLAEITFSLGLGPNVVGRDTSTGFPAAAGLPEVTVGGHSLSAEAILDLDPSVVLVDTSIGPPEVLTQLRGSGVDVVFLDPTRTLEGVPGQIRAVAAALGVPAAGETLVARVADEVAAARALLPRQDPPLRVAFLYLRGSAVSLLAGPGSGADSLITAIGAVDVGTDVGLTRAFTPITSEALITAAPDVLLLMTGGLASVDGVDGLLRVPGVAQTPAGQHRRVVDVEDTALLSFGPRTAAIMTALSTAVHSPAGA